MKCPICKNKIKKNDVVASKITEDGKLPCHKSCLYKSIEMSLGFMDVKKKKHMKKPPSR